MPRCRRWSSPGSDAPHHRGDPYVALRRSSTSKTRGSHPRASAVAVAPSAVPATAIPHSTHCGRTRLMPTNNPTASSAQVITPKWRSGVPSQAYVGSTPRAADSANTATKPKLTICRRGTMVTRRAPSVAAPRMKMPAETSSHLLGPNGYQPLGSTASTTSEIQMAAATVVRGVPMGAGPYRVVTITRGRRRPPSPRSGDRERRRTALAEPKSATGYAHNNACLAR